MKQRGEGRIMGHLPGLRPVDAAAAGLRPPPMYRTWHQKAAAESFLVDRYKWPETVYPVGKAVRILYYSDKWEADGHAGAHQYQHDFDSHPEVYMAVPGYTGEGAKALSALIRAPQGGVASWPVLAVVLELTFSCDGMERTEHLENDPHGAPIMTCPDNRTLVILRHNDPIVIRGGQMDIHAHGIRK